MTIASLQDLGYQVNLNAADTYSLPLRVLSIEDVNSKTPHQCSRTQQPEFIVVPKQYLVT